MGNEIRIQTKDDEMTIMFKDNINNEQLARAFSYLPYTFELFPLDDGTWGVEVKELEGCMSFGRDPNEAIQNIKDAIAGYIETLLEDGRDIPLPEIIKE